MPSVGEGRKRRFHTETLAVIQAILEQMPKVRTAKAVELYLMANYPQTVNVEDVSCAGTGLATTKKPSPSKAIVQGKALVQGEGFSPSEAFSQDNSSPAPLANPLDSASLALNTNLPAHETHLPQLAMHMLDRQTQALDTIANSLDALLRRQESIDALIERAENAENEAQTLKNDLKTLRLLVDSSEKTQQADLDQIRTWVGKILQKRTS